MNKVVAQINDAFTGKIRLKVSAKGAIQVDGMRRFPITLYRDEMEALLTRTDAIRTFIKDNLKALKEKPETEGSSGGVAI